MSDLSTRIAANLAGIHDRIENACRRSGRSAAGVHLVAVTKYAQTRWVQALIDLGVTHLGESRPQQLVKRAESLTETIEWHLIGHLQRNKVRALLPHVGLIHSVDSLRLAKRISEIAGEQSLTSAVLLEANVSGEASKDGFATEQLCADWPILQQLPNLQITGLMTMAPAVADPRASRPTFAKLRELRDQLRSSASSAMLLPQLSMGMSDDFEVAIEEGATLIRIGSALFESLQ